MLRLGRRFDRTAEEGRFECDCEGDPRSAMELDAEKEKLCCELLEREKDPSALLVVISSGCAASEASAGFVKRVSKSSSLRSKVSSVPAVLLVLPMFGSGEDMIDSDLFIK